MFNTNKQYKIIRARNGCRGIETAIVRYLGDDTDLKCRGLEGYDKNTCIVRVIELNDAWGKVGNIWRINNDCEYEEVEVKKIFSWKDTLDCKKLFPKDFYSCIDIAKSINYPFICFNGQIYSTEKYNYNSAIGTEKELN